MASSQALPEPMNSSPHHSKVKVTIALADSTFVAGAHVSGKVEMECRADRGLGIGILMIELFAIQELTSRDHSATSTFLHSRRLFQGPGLPPSNAVQAHPMPGDPPLPQHYYQARRGHSTFLFRIPIPASSPSSISFGSGLAKVLYELRASVGVYWKNEKRLVVDKRPIDVVEAYPYEETYLGKVPEGIVVGENGKLWMQGKMVGSVVVAGESACLELQVKNHSNKKNTGLTLTLTRTLYLPGSATGQRPTPVQISDTLTTVPFRGPEYIIPSGAEGVANLVFDVPKHAQGVRGGTLDGEESEGGLGPRHTESLFEIKCKVEVKLTMGMGSKDVVLEIPVEVVHPTALPSPQQPPGPFSQAYPPPESMLNVAPYPDYNPYYAAQPMSSAPLSMPYIDPINNQVWLPPPPPIPTHTPLGYLYSSQSPIQPDLYQPPLQPYAMPQPYYGSPQPQQNLFVPLESPVGLAEYIPRPSSAAPVTSASEVPPPILPGLPALLPPTSLLPLRQLNQPQDHIAAEQLEPEAGKGERALRVTQHLRLSSRNRSVSPQSHRYPLPAPLGHINEVQVQDPSSAATTVGTSSNAGPLRLRNLPPPPGLSRAENLSISPPPVGGAVVHSPRPQLTPKHSFTRDPILGATSKSVRVEELEKMADEVARKSQDLSCDLPKGIRHLLNAAETEVNVNKTLPGPPVPSGKNLLSPPTRARADLYFAGQDPPVPETSPLPSDQTPPTPALLAVLPSRQLRADRNELKTENGLDALERRLLAEVGTRKLDTRHLHKDQRPDVRGVLPIDTALTLHGTTSIPIPQKSPEPLHDSAISSLTLAGGLGGDDSDGEFDGRTHRAGRSRSGSSDGRDGMRSGLHMHMRERAQVSSPPKTSNTEREKAREKEEKNKAELEKAKEKEKSKEGKTSGKKKDRSSNKSAAKGRVAAWLGGIDPDVPPQEQIIPPSPSVLRDPHSPLELADDNGVQPSPLSAPEPLAAPEAKAEAPKGISASPNPRSSGFVPIATLKRNSIQAPPLLLRDTSVTADARRVQDIWSSASPPAPTLPAPKFSLAISPVVPPLSIRTDRRVSPPSSKATPADPRSNKPNMPLSYSAAARNVWKTAEVVQANAVSPPPPNKDPVYPPLKGRVPTVFPLPKPIDPEVKYDIRSARGGRGGKVTAVANLWSSGAISSDVQGKGVPKRLYSVEQLPPPSKPLRMEKKLFSAAVMTPAPPVPKQVPRASGSGASPAKPLNEAQKRPDSRGVFFASKSPNSGPAPKRMLSSTALSTPSSRPEAGRSGQSAEALVYKRPATAMAKPYSLHGKVAPTNLSTPTSSDTKLHGLGLAAKGAKPVIKRRQTLPLCLLRMPFLPFLLPHPSPDHRSRVFRRLFDL
ncbi:hypothetical protein BDZ97DRAFT_1821755 [Flammula alnicola]|nr:hypothetical protein BDZ97DRAFT_1821755 [Flammula alnicola]